MQKSTKGALAASAAAILLLGGAGSLAYWTADQDIPGGTITSGQLTLSAPACADWTLDGGGTFTPGTTELVPGDSISRVCDLSLVAEGEHIGATLDVDDAAVETGALGDVLEADATFTVDGAAYAPITAAGTYAIEATITVDFPYGTLSTPDPLTGADNTTQDESAVLDAISVVAVQTHTP